MKTPEGSAAACDIENTPGCFSEGDFDDHAVISRMRIGQDRLPRELLESRPQHEAFRGLEWAFLLFVLLVASYAFSIQGRLETLSWYLIYLAALGLFVLRYGSLLSAVWLSGPILLWPLCAGISFFWSDNPEQTLRATVQLSMTVLIGAYIGGRFSLHDICRALFWVLFACALVSLIVILVRSNFAYDHNGVARGIFPHKNVLGGRMVLLLICSTLLFAIGRHRLLALAAGAIALALVAVSHSATAILMTFGFCALIPVLLAWRSPAPLRLMSYLVALLFGTFALWVILSFDINPVGLTLEALGKERTLSGRSVLWDFAITLIERRPLLGVGFDAFWDGRDGSQSSYVQYAFRQDIQNFHNSYLDITVQLGLFGMIITGLTGLWFALRALGGLNYGTNAMSSLPALLLAFVAVYSLSEYAFFRQHSLIQILFSALAIATARFVAEARTLGFEITGDRQSSPSVRCETLYSQR